MLQPMNAMTAPHLQTQGYKTLIYPGIFLLKINPATKEYFLDKKEFQYKTPNKYYGEVKSYIDFYWRSIVRNNYNGGVMLTGQKGSGKSLIAMELSNRAIQAGMRVVEITKVQFRPELLEYLDKLDNAVLFFDEFGKNFNKQQQDQMLTLLNNSLGKQRIVLITENNKINISDFIRSRPGRIRYAMHFNKLSRKTLLDYCSEFPIEEDFMADLLRVYDKAVEFQFDHLKVIVEEHLNNKDIPLDELLTLLNLDSIAMKKVLIPIEAINIKEPDKVYEIINKETAPLDNFEYGMSMYLSLKEVKEPDPEQANTQQPQNMLKFGMGNKRLNSYISKKSTIKIDDNVLEAYLDDYPDIIIRCEIDYK